MPSTTPRQPACALRVLVVDDELLIRWAIAQALGDRGCTVVDAPDAASAGRALQAADRPFDVVLLDYRLPDAHDLSLLQRVRRQSPASRVFMITADMPPEVSAHARRMGARAVLSKPLDLDVVSQLVTDAARDLPEA